MELTVLKITNYGKSDILKVAKYTMLSGVDRFNSFSMAFNALCFNKKDSINNITCRYLIVSGNIKY